MIPIIVLSICIGFCSGMALTYALMKSYAAALSVCIGALINIGLLVYVLRLTGVG